MKTPKPPARLKPAGRNFWRKAMAQTVFEEAHDLERLAMACGLLDEIAEDEKRVRADGRYLRDRYGNLREHPGVKSVRDNRTLFCRVVRELALDITPGPESRPPRQYGA
ncbi:MAG: hypothetical protein WCI75_08650 [candidate division NC10 bacterium]